MSNRTKLPRRTRKIPVARKLPVRTREKIETAIEKLINILDAIEPDPEIEEDDHGGGDVVDEPHDVADEGDTEPDSDGEPSLGSRNEVGQIGWCFGTSDDCERDKSDDEPSLGSLNTFNQSKWAASSRSDREDDDEREPSEDNEPSLGAPEGFIRNQEHWQDSVVHGGYDFEQDDCDDEEEHDREFDPAESGIRDDGGLAEQMWRARAVVRGAGVSRERRRADNRRAAEDLRSAPTALTTKSGV